MDFTNFLLLDDNGDQADADACGPHVAFNCMDCGYAVLASAIENKRGFDRYHPAECRGCGEQYFLDVRDHAEKLYILRLMEY
ncbi:hypothetical protein OVA24_15535 [Luteolibacter sp. SL250]|uniref:hypothetical protein n=1 Tax=Luteolibacter sp. SL250 TaxID=2995170 RepID=UPI00226DC210|nr:hypothetical protein [Luteolibacter sp. SL250]WAC18644.1 hypothetical protein OVA24_15535 [Luteolibacter sp. SL250]